MTNNAPFPKTALKRDIAYAGFWRRALAYVIDAFLLSGVGAITAALVVALAPDDREALFNVPVVTVAIGWAYFVLFETSPAQGTLGKIALELYVTDLHGDPISYPRAVFRYLFKSFSSLLCFVGWPMAAFTPRKQALHDLLAGTLVLRRVTYLVIGDEPPAEPGEHWDGSRWVASVTPMERT